MICETYPPIDMVADVLRFHRKFGCYTGDHPHGPPRPVVKLRLDLIIEEYGEVLRACDRGNLAGVAYGLVDLIYVSIGKALAWGIDLRPIWRAVQRANMAKEGGGQREDGKILKPPGWQPPDVEGLIQQQVALAESNGGSIWIPNATI